MSSSEALEYAVLSACALMLAGAAGFWLLMVA